jgi:hypothetical protein
LKDAPRFFQEKFARGVYFHATRKTLKEFEPDLLF